MQTLPITLALFSSTKGHFKHRDVYRATLAHWDRALPISSFGQRVAHVKISLGQEAIGEQMATDLRALGFHVLTTTADWSRGLSHGANYLGDMVKVSKDARVYTQPYLLILEDDTPLQAYGATLDDILLRSCQLLATNHELVSVRTIRRGDYEGGVPQLAEAENGRAFYSPNLDFQTPILRSLDFYRIGMLLEANPQACQSVQCEMLFRLLCEPLSRSPHKHLVWKPEHIEALHLGTPDYLNLKASLNL
jgi:hypothetical protein